LDANVHLCSKQLCNIKRFIRDYSYKFLNNQGHWLNIVKLKTSMCFSWFGLWFMNVHVTQFSYWLWKFLVRVKRCVEYNLLSLLGFGAPSIAIARPPRKDRCWNARICERVSALKPSEGGRRYSELASERKREREREGFWEIVPGHSYLTETICLSFRVGIWEETMRRRSPSYSPPRRRRSPSPRGRRGYNRGVDLPTSLLVRNIPRDCR